MITDEMKLELMTRAVLALEAIAENSRIMAKPTEDEVRERLETSLAMANFLDTTKPSDQPYN